MLISRGTTITHFLGPQPRFGDINYLEFDWFVPERGTATRKGLDGTYGKTKTYLVHISLFLRTTFGSVYY